MAPREAVNNAYAKFWGNKRRASCNVMVFSGVVNSFSIVWGQGNARMVNSPPSSRYMASEQHCVLLMQLVLILFSSLFWFNELHLELSVQNSIEGGIPSESHYRSLNYRKGNNNSTVQDFVHLDDYTQPTYEMTPGFKPFTQKEM